MDSIRVKAYEEVGEIDTRAPFGSVKAAVSLFGGRVGSAGKLTLRKANSLLKESELIKEAQFLLAQEELSQLKEQLKNAESTKAQALEELDCAKKTVEELTNKLNTVNESKKVAAKATREVKNQAERPKDPCFIAKSENDIAWMHKLDGVREQYVTTIKELDAAKQELSSMRNDFKASMDAKVSALRQDAEAKQLSDAKTEKANHLSEEIGVARESLAHVKLASVEAQQQESNVFSEKDTSRHSRRLELEETEKKLLSLKKEFNPELNQVLEAKLAEKYAEIGSVQKELEITRTSDAEYVAMVKTELDSAKEVLHRVAEEDNSLRYLVEALQLELEALKKEHSVLKQKNLETESTSGDLSIKLQNCTEEIEAAMADDLATLQQLSLESKNARTEAEAMNKTAEKLRAEAEASRVALDETEKKVQVAVTDAAAAKAAENNALACIRCVSERKGATRDLTSETRANIRISREEYESLSQKVEECEKLADTKVAGALAQVESVRAGENEAINRLEAARKEMEELEVAIEEALKRAELAEAAKTAVESEMRRLHEKEQKKTVVTASRLLAEAQMSTESLLPRARISDANLSEKTEVNRVVRSASKKKSLPNLSRIFHRKRSQSLPCLPDELRV